MIREIGAGKSPRSIAMSPGSRPSPSLPSQGHNSPTTTSRTPMVISHRLIILGRHFALKQYGSLSLPGSLQRRFASRKYYPREVFSVSYPIRQTDLPGS